MAIKNGTLVLHLGSIDESFLRNQECYLCVRSVKSDVAAALYVCWRVTCLNESTSSALGEITYRELDPDKDPITPLHIEMLAGEELPHLLQTLLVGVEHAICRIPLDELTFPSSSSFAKFQTSDGDTASLVDCKNAISKRATSECNLKRRELITKNNSINKKKYAVKRITQSGSICDNENETFDDELCDKDEGSLTSPPITASTLPLFCLGGSFPHIDSDSEESGDDAKKTQSGECCNNNKKLSTIFIYLFTATIKWAQSAF